MNAPSATTDAGPAEPDRLDVVLAGTVFFDLVFTGFPQPPALGTEVFTDGMGCSPGGIANLAVASARLGLRTGLVAGFGDDLYADWLCRTLAEQEHVDLSHSRRFDHWHTPVTVSLAREGDRSLITHGHPTPVPLDELVGPQPPESRAVIVDVGDPRHREDPWWRRSAASGSLVFADAGWDPDERWGSELLDALEGCHAFTPNCAEAMAYTRTSSPEQALAALADRVPLAVVTCGRDGALAVDSSTGERARVPSLEVAAIDTTGAGDTFASALVRGTLLGWPLEHRLRFASLCAALAVQNFGGALAAPGWGDIADWWTATSNAAAEGRPGAAETLARYAFVHEHIPAQPGRVRRAEATIARFSDAAPSTVPGSPTLPVPEHDPRKDPS
ncbi:PfkB domain protein [Beutenbergia cavernae DSM 12333]|uniref:PfkB domain protein n=1 Tax=Beutenbergia cavernae (strain ATCC BAA-8 / DSM 12333 / CCUG 43141 / JCM 11478 / NBRC 16432 / NCIMB 13614 / HKI 0122) TaxID=471853 RepID=C5BXF1_BEUC1|nr:PfkB family carbohydrate kinase [Beutenbergia cavernae]ACQ80834.1 PfkB domain protein [Beutenbergia cavernae DSM 12333]